MNRWAIPTASLIPLLACVFAFSLGPSPHKHAHTFEIHEGSKVERVAALEAAGPETWRVLLASAKRPTCGHRTDALEFLAEHQVPGARALFQRIVKNEAESSAVRTLARTLLERHPIATNTP